MTFRITIEKSGHSFECPADKPILAAALEAGYVLPYNCRSGLCSMCRGRILQGEIEYKDQPLSYYLSEAERANGSALLCQAQPRSDLLIDAQELLDLSELTPRKIPCRLSSMERVAPDVMLVRLRLPMNENVYYLAGQHLAIELGDGSTRNYSIASACPSAGVTEIELHIRHQPGGMFSDKLFHELKPRSLLRIEMPLGTFYLDAKSSKPIIMIATGTGFAPIKAMLETVFAKGLVEERKIDFYWGGRTRRDLYLNDLVQNWGATQPGFRYIPVLSRPTDQCRWEGLSGYVQGQIAVDHPDLSNHEIYACGSPAMVRDARQTLIERCHADPAAIFADEFLPAIASENALKETLV